MKNLFLVLLLAGAGLMSATADQNTYFKPGSLLAQAGVAFGYWGLGVEGGADLSLGQASFAPVFPIDYGVAVRGALGFGKGLGFGVGGYGTAHYSFKALKSGSPYVDKLETSIAIGLDFAPGAAFPLWIGYFDTWSYHIDDKLAVELGYYSLSWYTLGVTYRLN
jgi:hypothetical protein